MPDEVRLREQARAAVQSGKEQMEFEIQFARDGDNPGLDKFHVHIRCYAAWEFERNKPRPS
jgi:hypothetical protein